MPIFLDVEPRLDNEFAQHVADGVRKAILGALTDITAALSLTDDEKIALQNYRAQRRAQATEAHEVIVMQLNAAQRESDA